MCSSRKNPYPPHGWSPEIPRGRGVLKVKILEAKYEAKLEFPEGRGVAKQNPLLGEYGYFLELHNVVLCSRTKCFKTWFIWMPLLCHCFSGCARSRICNGQKIQTVREIGGFWDIFCVFWKRNTRLFTVPLFFRGILETGRLRWSCRHLGL